MIHLQRFESFTGTITEKMGVSMAVDTTVKQVVDIIISDDQMMDTVNKVIKGYDGNSEHSEHKSFVVNIDGSELKQTDFNIDGIIIEVAFDVSTKYPMGIQHTGVFPTNRFSVDDDNKAAFLILAAIHSNADEWKKAIVDDTITDEIRKHLSGVLEHEMTHAYESYKRHGHNLDLSDAKDSIYASTANLLREAMQISDKRIFERLSYFLFFVYYTTSFEINAKVAETWPLLRDVKDSHERLEILKKTDVWKYANELRNFSASDMASELKDVLKEKYKAGDAEAENNLNGMLMKILNQFIIGDQDDIKSNFMKFLIGGGSLEDRLKMHKAEFRSMLRSKDYKSFLYFWERRFKRAGDNIYRRISKLTTLDPDE